MIEAGEKDAAKVREAIIKNMETEPLAKVDYVEIVDNENLEPVQTIDVPCLVATAVYIGKTRLIDNFVTA